MRTIRDIRRNAPATDRHEKALAPSSEPHWATARDGSRYVATSIYPHDNDELRALCREFGHAAVTDVEWGGVTVWLMNASLETDLRNPIAVASLAVLLVRDRDRAQLGWPTHDGAKRAPLLLDALSADVRSEAELVARETLSDWVKAGKPHGAQRAIKMAYRYLVSCPAFIARYVDP